MRTNLVVYLKLAHKKRIQYPQNLSTNLTKSDCKSTILISESRTRIVSITIKKLTQINLVSFGFVGCICIQLIVIVSDLIC